MASAVQISIDVPHKATAALFAAMKREEVEFGKSLTSQVKIAAWSIGKTLGTATRVARPQVEVLPVPIRMAKKLGLTRKLGNKTFIAKKYHGGKPFDQIIYAKGIREARKDRRVQNYRFGLAKLSWRASISGLGSLVGLGVSKANEKTMNKAMQKAVAVRSYKKDDPMIMIGSYLPYTQDALIGGMSAVGPAVERAAGMMMHIMDAKAEKALERMAKA